MTGRGVSYENLSVIDDPENNILSNEICDYELDLIMNRINLFPRDNADGSCHSFSGQNNTKIGISLEGEMYDVVLSSGDNSALHGLY